MTVTAPQSALVKAQNKHWYFLDIMKGFLLVLVFVGHLIPGEVTEQPVRYLIYSFHMPLFIGISGFLFNIERQQLTVKSFVQKYAKRLILPWFIAVTFYYLYNNLVINHKALSVKRFLHNIYSPYYHLWYVLGAVGYIVASLVLWQVIKNLRCRWYILFAIGIFFAIVSRYQIALNFVTEHNIISGKLLSAYKMLRIDFKPFNYLMFVCGMYLRNLFEHGKLQKVTRFTPLFAVLSAVLFAADIMLFFMKSEFWSNAIYLTMSIPFLAVTVAIAVSGSKLRIKPLEFIGQYSLPIYLYHVVGIRFAYKIFERGSLNYYIVACASFVVLCIAVYLLKNVPFVNKVIFGSTNSFLQKKNKEKSAD